MKLEDGQEVAEVLHFSSNYDVTTFLLFGRTLVYPFSDFWVAVSAMRPPEYSSSLRRRWSGLACWL